MPFTPAHAAAALPVRRLWPALPFSALVIGSMSPDFEYLLRLAPTSRLAHSLAGLVVFCVPAGLFVWAIFTHLVRPAILDVMPDGMARAVSPARTPVGTAALAIAIGALTHLVWDSFTHAHDWTVEHWSVLRAPVSSRLLPGMAWYKLLQHASTVCGLAVLAIAVFGWVRATPADARRFGPGQRQKAVRLLSVVAAAGVAGAALNGIRGAGQGIEQALTLGAVGGMLGTAAGLLGVGLWRAWQRQ